MRNMSVTLTTPQVKEGTKLTTRRLGWTFLKPGDRLMLCKKVQGRRLGEPLERIRAVKVTGVRAEPLNLIDEEGCVREGFPNYSPADFVAFFCDEMKKHPKTGERVTGETLVTVIDWEYIPLQWKSVDGIVEHSHLCPFSAEAVETYWEPCPLLNKEVA